ncbi:hypothetical protein DSLASN_44300 [Desulfoluna limicola]|uniref:Uncharacterized protein n=1 Tax=Desulfoluna limicola TaxID=2810562 RepID=A0ABM7PMN7_9BACT|nr:hypothetical protein DSLASN_44300 [Desulfoluna limicola]
MNDQLSYQTTRMFHTGDARPKRTPDPPAWLQMKGTHKPRHGHRISRIRHGRYHAAKD